MSMETNICTYAIKEGESFFLNSLPVNFTSYAKNFTLLLLSPLFYNLKIAGASYIIMMIIKSTSLRISPSTGSEMRLEQVD